ncbi:DUF3854 domain-containing protein [Peptococcaceae bacterium]|nr:DUF3854 domain-containing protein [Peptococcaceae bacterium]
MEATKNKNLDKEPLQRVNNRHRCPICNRPDWCGFNTQVAVCMRTESNYLTKNGGWMHKLQDAPELPPLIESEKPLPTAPVEIRDRVYRDFLNFLNLSQKHHQELLVKRGLSKETIQQMQFRSTPLVEKPWLVCQKLINWGHNLEGIPGFYRVQNSRGGNYWTFSMKPGFIIPIRNKHGKIQALQIRLDKPDSLGKYRLFSSSKKRKGSCSGVPVHIARPRQLTELTDRRIWITEGPLKATIASQHLGAIVLGIIGVSSWKPVLELLQKHSNLEIITAFDTDQVSNIQVKRAVNELTNELLQAKHTAKKAVWNNCNGNCNGLDDAVLAGEKITLRG